MATATARSLVCAHFTAAQLSPAEGESSSLKAFAKSVKSNGLSAVPHSRKSVTNRRRTCANGSSSRRRQPVMAAAGDGATKKCRITLLPGDGIGPEIMAVAVKLLKALGELEGITFEFQEALVGGAAIDEFGVPLPDSTLATCRDSDAVLLAAIGGYKWDTLPADLRPERGLLGLRAGLGAFANLRPATVFPQLIEASSLKREVVEGVDIMVVRELTGGIYFGEPKGFGQDAEGNRTGFNTMIYSAPEIDRIARVGFEAARKRSGRLCSVEKSNVLEVSQLWRERVTAIGAEEYPDVELSHMYVDNAAMQLIRNPRQFDTIVTGNIFGDILSDEASMLTGSIGMLPSASIGSDGPGIYEPVHGSAPDIAGQDKANPMAQVLSAAMMLRYGLNLPRGADLLEAAVMSTLEAGYRTVAPVALADRRCRPPSFACSATFRVNHRLPNRIRLDRSSRPFAVRSPSQPTPAIVKTSPPLPLPLLAFIPSRKFFPAEPSARIYKVCDIFCRSIAFAIIPVASLARFVARFSSPERPVATPPGAIGSAAPVTASPAISFVPATAATTTGATTGASAAAAAAAVAAAAAFALVVCSSPALAAPAASPQETAFSHVTAFPIPLSTTSAIPLGTVSSIPLATVTQAPLLATASAMSSSGVEWEVLVPSLVGVTPASALLAATAAAGALGLGFALFIAVG
ncbi:unnamed protein product [Closterium sp. NIES-54]